MTINNKQDFIYCPHCGAQIEPDQEFCDQCGTRLADYMPSDNGGRNDGEKKNTDALVGVQMDKQQLAHGHTQTTTVRGQAGISGEISKSSQTADIVQKPDVKNEAPVNTHGDQSIAMDTVTAGASVPDQTTVTQQINVHLTRLLAGLCGLLGVVCWFINLWGTVGGLAIIMGSWALFRKPRYLTKAVSIIGLISGLLNLAYAIAIFAPKGMYR